MSRQPAMFLTHGGGPMPILGSQESIGHFLRSAAKLLPQKPKAIVCVTAHWETTNPTVSTNPKPPMLYDYYGFPAEAYQLKYPAPGSPELAGRVVQLLRDAGLPAGTDDQRGFDHGTFVPLYLMFPEADVPVVQVSVMVNMDPEQHIQMGKALEALRDENVLIVGSGSSFHNMQIFRQSFSGKVKPDGLRAATDFDTWLRTACCKSSPQDRVDELKAWTMAPGSKLSHPREEHLIPLHVVVGAAGQDKGKLIFNDSSMSGLKLSSFMFAQSAFPRTLIHSVAWKTVTGTAESSGDRFCR